MRRALRLLPLPALIIALYLVVAYVDEGVFARTLVSLTLPSGRAWTVDLHDLFVAGALLVLFLEIFKSTRATSASRSSSSSRSAPGSSPLPRSSPREWTRCARRSALSHGASSPSPGTSAGHRRALSRSTRRPLRSRRAPRCRASQGLTLISKEFYHLTVGAPSCPLPLEVKERRWQKATLADIGPPKITTPA